MPEPVSGLSVVIDDPDNSVRIDPVTGTVETDQPDGGIVVQLDAHRSNADSGGNDFYRNLAETMDAQHLARLGNDLCDAIQADDRSRGSYLAILSRGLDLLGIELKEPSAVVGDSSAAVEGMATVTNPLLLEACLKGWANSQAELLPSMGPVKVATKGDETKVEDDLADALERDMNYYLTEVASEYYPDTSHMLLWGVYFGGSGFKKVYRCPLRRRPVSDSVEAKNLIVSDTTKDLRSCERITHQIPMRPSVMKRMKLMGAYRDTAAVVQPMLKPNEVDAKIAAIQGTNPSPQRPEDQPYTVWESQCELDLDEFAPAQFKGKGIPLPYIVSIDKDSREILALRRDWREDDDQCERQRMYVRYPYVPGPGFYGTGMLHILGNASAAMTAAWRLALDSAMFGNFPAGLADKSAVRQNTSDYRLSAGTFAPVETGGRDIRTLFMPTPYRDVTVGMLALMDKVTTQAQGLGAAADIPTAEGVQNVPVGTMLAQIEQATKVMAAAHKGMHHAQSEEINLLVDLFRQYPEDFWRNNKVAPKDYWSEQKLLQALNDCNLIPASDPNTPSHIHRVAKAVALSQLIAVPAFMQRMDPGETLIRILTAIKEDPQGLIVQAPPQAQGPDPNMIKAQAALTSANTAQTKAQTAAQTADQNAQIKMAELSGEKDIATVDLAKEMLIHSSDAQQAQADAMRAQSMNAAKHALNVGKARHDAMMDIAQHGLNVHQALNPPSPSNNPSAP